MMISDCMGFFNGIVIHWIFCRILSGFYRNFIGIYRNYNGILEGL
jgi:hypothetical protein